VNHENSEITFPQEVTRSMVRTITAQSQLKGSHKTTFLPNLSQNETVETP